MYTVCTYKRPLGRRRESKWTIKRDFSTSYLIERRLFFTSKGSFTRPNAPLSRPSGRKSPRFLAKTVETNFDGCRRWTTFDNFPGRGDRWETRGFVDSQATDPRTSMTTAVILSPTVRMWPVVNRLKLSTDHVYPAIPRLILT